MADPSFGTGYLAELAAGLTEGVLRAAVSSRLLSPLSHHHAQTPSHQRGPLSWPGGVPCPGPADRVDLRA
jgi:hypothetical protein